MEQQMNQNPFGLQMDQQPVMPDLSEVRNIVTNPNFNLSVGAPLVGSEAPLDVQLDLGDVQAKIAESEHNAVKAIAKDALFKYQVEQLSVDYAIQQAFFHDTKSEDKELVDA